MEQKVQTKCQDSQKKEQKDGIPKGREKRKCNIGDKMLLNNSRCDTSQSFKEERTSTWHLPFVTQCHHAPMTKTGLAEEGGITIRGATTRILIFGANRGIRLMNFTWRSPV
jgi:hypothetical protein